MLHHDASRCSSRASEDESFSFFSLCDETKDWLYLQPIAITTWREMKRKLLEKFLQASRTTTIRKKISGIRQLHGKTLYKYWE